MTNTNTNTVVKGRPVTFKNARAVAGALNDVSTISRFLREQLVAKGYLTKVAVKSGTRGRPTVDYVLTGKARGLVAMSKNWK